MEDGGLGFDFKWNMGWMNDFIDYMKCDPLFRKGHHGELTFSMIYAYSENFILVLSHDEVVHGKGSMINKMPGSHDQKFANLRVAYGYMMAHPGKKLLFMGQDIAQFDEWNENESIQWNLLEYDVHREMKDYVKALNRLCKDYPALYRMDFSSDGFEWINNMDADRSIISFLRKTDKEEETLLIVCNFTPVVYENFKVGVPFKGKFKETFNSDKEVFGGKGYVNPRLRYSKEDECDGRENSIQITIPPLGISVFTCVPLIGLEPSKKTEKISSSKLIEKTSSNKKTEKTSSGKKTEITSSSKKTKKTSSDKKTEKTSSTKKTSKSEKESDVKVMRTEENDVQGEVAVTIVEPHMKEEVVVNTVGIAEEIKEEDIHPVKRKRGRPRKQPV